MGFLIPPPSNLQGVRGVSAAGLGLRQSEALLLVLAGCLLGPGHRPRGRVAPHAADDAPRHSDPKMGPFPGVGWSQKKTKRKAEIHFGSSSPQQDGGGGWNCLSAYLLMLVLGPLILRQPHVGLWFLELVPFSGWLQGKPKGNPSFVGCSPISTPTHVWFWESMRVFVGSGVWFSLAKKGTLGNGGMSLAPDRFKSVMPTRF